MRIHLCCVQPLGRVRQHSSKIRRNEQLDACFLAGRNDLQLDVKGPYRNGADDDVHTGQGVLEGLLARIVDLDHLGASFNRLRGLWGT